MIEDLETLFKRLRKSYFQPEILYASNLLIKWHRMKIHGLKNLITSFLRKDHKDILQKNEWVGEGKEVHGIQRTENFIQEKIKERICSKKVKS